MAKADDGLRKVAAAWIDGNFHERQQTLVREHRRLERNMLVWEQAQHKRSAWNAKEAEDRYLQRIRTIDERRDRIADRIYSQHNSIAGRLAAMTKKGRAAQAEQIERLDDRADQLRQQAGRNLSNLNDRMFRRDMEDRVFRARQIKLFRVDHMDARLTQTQRHQQSRDRMIDDRVQAMQRVIEKERRQQAMEKKQDLRQTFDKASGQDLRNTFNQAQSRKPLGR